MSSHTKNLGGVLVHNCKRIEIEIIKVKKRTKVRKKSCGVVLLTLISGERASGVSAVIKNNVHQHSEAAIREDILVTSQLVRERVILDSTSVREGVNCVTAQ